MSNATNVPSSRPVRALRHCDRCGGLSRDTVRVAEVDQGALGPVAGYVCPACLRPGERTESIT